MPNNRNLKIAQKAKKDEFYTQYSDIAKELPYYKEQLANKMGIVTLTPSNLLNTNTTNKHLYSPQIQRQVLTDLPLYYKLHICRMSI